MSAKEIAAVRHFNRVVTERVGALRDDYLGRARPLGASRVLWQIGRGAADVRTLRTELDLDSGYLSRLLRSLEAEGLVTLQSASGDGRVRVVHLTDAGHRESAMLDRSSDALAESILAPLNPDQRSRLVDAMATVRLLLTAGLVEPAVEDPASNDARFCIEQYFAELDQRFESGFDPAISNSAGVDELTDPAGLFLVARLRGEPLGCGGLKFHDDRHAEIKRMWVSPSARGLGVGRRLLQELERHAAERGVIRLTLETNRSLAEAISLYRSAGYEEVPAFNDEPFAHHWFEKRLGDPR